jgi:hypothetical protein
MLLTGKQRDALGEVINIAFARTAASLSQLSGHRCGKPAASVRTTVASGGQPGARWTWSGTGHREEPR